MITWVDTEARERDLPSLEAGIEQEKREIEQRQEMRDRLHAQAADLEKRRKIAQETGGTVELAERIEGLQLEDPVAEAQRLTEGDTRPKLTTIS